MTAGSGASAESGTAAASELVSSVKAGAESAGGVGERSRHVGGMVHKRTGVVIGVGPSGMSAPWLESRLGVTRSRVRIPPSFWTWGAFGPSCGRVGRRSRRVESARRKQWQSISGRCGCDWCFADVGVGVGVGVWFGKVTGSIPPTVLFLT